jgi:ribosome biogenesis GTPase A
MQLLDTPGILWPKFEDRTVGLRLAFCGSVRDEILDAEELAVELLRALLAVPAHAGLVSARYLLEADGAREADGEAELSRDAAPAVLGEIAVKRGFLLPGGRADRERAAKTVLDEFRAGRMGRITLERAPVR